MELLEKAAGHGHAWAMYHLGGVHEQRKEYEQAVGWFRKAAEAGLPPAMHNLGCCLDEGVGVGAPDYPAALYWYKGAADAGDGEAAFNLATMYATGRGRAWQMMPSPAASSSIF